MEAVESFEGAVRSLLGADGHSDQEQRPGHASAFSVGTILSEHTDALVNTGLDEEKPLLSEVAESPVIVTETLDEQLLDECNNVFVAFPIEMLHEVLSWLDLSSLMRFLRVAREMPILGFVRLLPDIVQGAWKWRFQEEQKIVVRQVSNTYEIVTSPLSDDMFEQTKVLEEFLRKLHEASLAFPGTTTHYYQLLAEAVVSNNISRLAVLIDNVTKPEEKERFLSFAIFLAGRQRLENPEEYLALLFYLLKKGKRLWGDIRVVRRKLSSNGIGVSLSSSEGGEAQNQNRFLVYRCVNNSEFAFDGSCIDFYPSTIVSN